MDTYKRAYRKLGNQSLFDSEDMVSKLTSLGNPLGRLAGTVDFEMFRETLEAGLYRERLTKAGAEIQEAWRKRKHERAHQTIYPQKNIIRRP